MNAMFRSLSKAGFDIFVATNQSCSDINKNQNCRQVQPVPCPFQCPLSQVESDDDHPWFCGTLDGKVVLDLRPSLFIQMTTGNVI